MASYIYHFKNSNGTHSFKYYDVGALNNEINNLKAELEKKPTEIVRTEVKEVINNPVNIVNNPYVIMFAKGSYQLSTSAIETLNLIPSDCTVNIIATASPEGNSDFNLNLSQLRADTVKHYLNARGVNVEYATCLGVQGDASNRIAIITIQ